jgi:hypothetical protein
MGMGGGGYPGGGQLAPQGFFGNFLSGIAPTVGGLFGQTGQQVGQGISPLLRLLPFSADPMMGMGGGGYPGGGQLAPQGFFGNFLSGIAPTVGGLFGQTGQQVGQGISPLLRLLPFSADPTMGMGGGGYPGGGQLAPQGFLGDLLGNIGAPVGQAIGGIWGQGQLGNQVGGLAGQLAQRFLPFSVDPRVMPYGAGGAGYYYR